MSKTVGIIGGLGPSSTVDLYRLITNYSPVQKDQDHLRIIIDSHPQIPDRTESILGNGPSPLPMMVESARLLERSGVEIIAIPCNTAHYFLEDLRNNVDAHILDMISETGLYLSQRGVRKVGLLSTFGTAKSMLYQKKLYDYGIEVVMPSESDLMMEMEAIYGICGIKSGCKFERTLRNKNIFLKIIDKLAKKGISHVIMGCTEIALCLEKSDTEINLINPTEILAKAVVREAYYDGEVYNDSNLVKTTNKFLVTVD